MLSKILILAAVTCSSVHAGGLNVCELPKFLMTGAPGLAEIKAVSDAICGSCNGNSCGNDKSNMANMLICAVGSVPCGVKPNTTNIMMQALAKVIPLVVGSIPYVKNIFRNPMTCGIVEQACCLSGGNSFDIADKIVKSVGYQYASEIPMGYYLIKSYDMLGKMPFLEKNVSYNSTVFGDMLYKLKLSPTDLGDVLKNPKIDASKLGDIVGKLKLDTQGLADMFNKLGDAKKVGSILGKLNLKDSDLSKVAGKLSSSLRDKVGDYLPSSVKNLWDSTLKGLLNLF